MLQMLFQTSLLVEIPPYRNQGLSTPVHVNFYVYNGKRKRSQHQHFTFVPANGKALLLLLHLLIVIIIIPAAFFLNNIYINADKQKSVINCSVQF